MPPTGGESAEWIRQYAQKDFIVYLKDYTMLAEINVEEAKIRTSPAPDDTEIGYKVIDYGETNLKGLKFIMEYLKT